MGTRSLVSGSQSKSSSDRRIGFGHLEVKKEFRIKKETPDDEIKEYAETAMNELLGWYGYDKVDSRDTQGLNLHHFAANKTSSSRRSPSDAESSDAEGAKAAPSPGRKDGAAQGSPSLPEQGTTPAGCIICSWCNKVVSHKMFSLKTPGGEKSFCSEMCFSQCRRANFKRNKTCDWCRHIRHTVNYVDFQDGEHQLQFCSDKCLNQYKMNIFCKETEAHLQLHPHLQGLGSSGGSGSASASVRLITPELWLRDCRSESPVSDGSASPTDGAASPIEIKVVMRPPSEPPQIPLKPPPSSLEITKIEKREKPRKNNLISKSRRQNRCGAGGGERRGSSSSPRSAESLTPPKPPFPPPLLPLNGTQIPHINPHAPLPPDPTLLRPPFLPLGCFPPSALLPPEHPLHRNPQRYDQILRPPLISPPSPSNPTVINPPPPPRAPPPPPPPPRSLLPPVTVLVPYPIALAIPIPLPIPIPIPLLPPKKPRDGEAPPPEAPPPQPPPPDAPDDASPPPAPRPLRKRKRVPDIPQEEDGINKRKTVPVEDAGADDVGLPENPREPPEQVGVNYHQRMPPTSCSASEPRFHGSRKNIRTRNNSKEPSPEGEKVCFWKIF